MEAEFGTPRSRLLRDKIRSGEVACPNGGAHCRPSLGTHVSGCPQSRAVLEIYDEERKAGL